MTISEIIHRVKSLYSKGVPSDETRLTSRHIYNKMLSTRSRLLTQELNRRRKVGKWNYQLLPCVELIEVPPYECSCLPTIGCNILRTKHKLPKSLVNYNQHIITSVTSLEGSVAYTEANLKYKKGNKYTKDKPSYYIENGYLYTTHTKGPRIIKIEGLFEDPIEVSSFPSYCPKSPSNGSIDDSCKPMLEQEFPIEADMVDILIQMTFDELINLFSKTIEDKTNNTADSPTEQSK